MTSATAGDHRRMPFVAGNWKMNTSVEEGVRLAEAVSEKTASISGVAVAVLPPFTHLRPVYDVLRDGPTEIGAQDVFWEQSGAYTGEVAAAMLAGWCDHVLVGHSERRHLLGETDEQVGRKFAAALSQGLHVIVAVGETESERDANATFGVVDRQLDAAFAPHVAPPASRAFVIAYEPVWAIGTGRTATPQQAQEVCAHIKTHVAALGVDDVRVLYGGSVTGDNAAALFAEDAIDGALVGGASLRAAEFAAIAEAAAGVAVEGRHR